MRFAAYHWYDAKQSTYIQKAYYMIELQEQDNKTLSTILDKYFIEHKIDKDGDISIDSESRVYMKVDKENEFIRSFAFIHLSELELVHDDEFDKYLDFINSMSYFTKFSKLKPNNKKSPLLCESCLVLFGSIDETFFIKTIKKTEKEIATAKKATINFKSILDNLIENDRAPA